MRCLTRVADFEAGWTEELLPRGRLCLQPLCRSLCYLFVFSFLSLFSLWRRYLLCKSTATEIAIHLTYK
jgi:hypothetical protein